MILKRIVSHCVTLKSSKKCLNLTKHLDQGLFQSPSTPSIKWVEEISFINGMNLPSCESLPVRSFPHENHTILYTPLPGRG